MDGKPDEVVGVTGVAAERKDGRGAARCSHEVLWVLAAARTLLRALPSGEWSTEREGFAFADQTRRCGAGGRRDVVQRAALVLGTPLAPVAESTQQLLEI